MKKVPTTIAAGLLALALAGCSGSSGEVVEPTSVDGSAVDATESSQQENAQNASSGVAATVEEQVLYDDNGIKVTLTGLDDSWAGPELALLVENDSGKDLTFQARNVSVNGYMIQDMMSVDVADGKKANDTLTLMSSDLEAAGIEAITDVEFSLHVFDTDTWDTYVDSPAITITTSAAGSYEQAVDDSGTPIYEGNGIRVIAKGLSDDNSIWGPGLIVFIENTGDTDVTVQTREESINGFMVSPIFSCDVVAGKRAISAITFFDSDLEDNGIDGVNGINELEIALHIFDLNTWDTIADSDPITLTF